MQSQKNSNCQQCFKKFHGSMNCVTYPQEIVFETQQKSGEIYLIGEWSKWQKPEYMRELVDLNSNNNNRSQYQATISVPIGEHRFKFIVDGVWTISNNYQIVQNDFGDQENIIRVYSAGCQQLSHQYHRCQVDPSYDFSNGNDLFVTLKMIHPLQTPQSKEIQNIAIKGSWDNWNTEIQLIETKNMLTDCSFYQQYIRVLPGKYQFKYIINGVWKHDTNQISEDDSFGGRNNIIIATISNSTSNSQQFMINDLYWNQIDCPELNFAAIQGHSMDLIADTIFIFGGFYHNNFLETLYGLNISTLEVMSLETKGKHMPDRRAYHGSIVIGQLLFIYGGLNERNIFNDLFILDSIKLIWTKVSLNNKPPAMERSSLTNYDNRSLLVFGGYYCSEDLEFEENYNQLYALDLENFQWNKIKTHNTPEERYSHTADTICNKFYVFGGIKRIGNSTQMYNDLYLLDLEPQDQQTDLSFQQVTDYKGKPPSPRYAHSSFVINSSLLGIFGGRRDKNIFLNDVFIFCISSNCWTHCQVQNVAPQGRCFHGCVTIKDSEVIIFGGQKANSFLNVGRINAIYSLKSNCQSNLTQLTNKLLNIYMSLLSICSYLPFSDSHYKKPRKEKVIKFI